MSVPPPRRDSPHCALLEMIDYRYPHTGLAQRAWDLRHTITFYDGLYVALEVPLLTADIRLSKASGLSWRVMLIH